MSFKHYGTVPKVNISKEAAICSAIQFLFKCVGFSPCFLAKCLIQMCKNTPSILLIFSLFSGRCF